MKIMKYGHSCLLVEMDGAAILIDPGSLNGQPDPGALDAILVTHEHSDHIDIGVLTGLLARFPQARVITHAAAGELLAKHDLEYEPIEPGAAVAIKGVEIKSYGTEHAVIYGTSPCRNCGFLIGGELYVPGDALHDLPTERVRVLALPTGGPWMKLAEAIDYAKAVKPDIVFPIHDALYAPWVRAEMIPRIIGGNLEPAGIAFADLAAGEARDF